MSAILAAQALQSKLKSASPSPNEINRKETLLNPRRAHMVPAYSGSNVPHVAHCPCLTFHAVISSAGCGLRMSVGGCAGSTGPSQRLQFLALGTITGMRVWIDCMSSFGSVVIMENVSSGTLWLGSFQDSPQPSKRHQFTYLFEQSQTPVYSFPSHPVFTTHKMHLLAPDNGDV